MTEKTLLKTVVVTGGATGIGLEASRLLLETGKYRVALVGRREARLKAALDTLHPWKDQVSIFHCDLKDQSQIHELISKLTHQFRNSGIYALVNNAGIYPFGDLGGTDVNSWDEIFDINLKAPFLLTQGLAPIMAKNTYGGRIVNVSSTAGIVPNHFALAYSVSKAGLNHFTKTVAKEVGRNGITVNCLCPGIVRSPLHEGYHHNDRELEEFYQKKGSSYPLGRVGEPKDVASTIRFLLSEDASWITGSVIVVDGGRLLL